MKKLRGGVNHTSANHAIALIDLYTELYAHIVSTNGAITNIFAPQFTFALRMTRASGWNIVKLYNVQQSEHLLLKQETRVRFPAAALGFSSPAGLLN